jgi:cephalosporin hydroxylase
MLFVVVSLHANSSELDVRWTGYKNQVLQHQSKIDGWCNQQKATGMMDLIYEVKPELCVEVGVFGGSSIYPTASALKFLGQGIVCAIDPWRHEDCLEGYDANDVNYQWWSKVDLEAIYQGFLRVLNRFHLQPYCHVMRMTGLEALNTFADGSIDILHIDGNHTKDSALSDAEMYLPKVKQGGYIWFDDVNWASTAQACQFLKQHCVKIEALSTDEYYLFHNVSPNN